MEMSGANLACPFIIFDHFTMQGRDQAAGQTLALRPCGCCCCSHGSGLLSPASCKVVGKLETHFTRLPRRPQTPTRCFTTSA